MKKSNIIKTISLALLISTLAANSTMAQTHKGKGSAKGSAKSSLVVSTMTVQNIAPATHGEDYIKVQFVGWDKVLKLSVKANPQYAKALKESMDKHKPAYIYRTNDQSDIIQKVVVAGTPGQKKKKK